MPEPRPGRISEQFIEEICQRVRAGQRTRRSLPEWGRIHVERLLPFTVVYRRPEGRDDPETYRFATAHGSYLTAASARRVRAGVRELAEKIAATQAESFGTSLLLEVWSNPELLHQPGDPDEAARPTFRIHVARRLVDAGFVRKLVEELSSIRIAKRRAEVEVVPSARPAPPAMRPLVAPGHARIHLVGLELAPIHVAQDGAVYPLVRREFVRKLTRALSMTFYEFARDETSARPRSFHALGRRATVQAVWEIDRHLAEIGSSYELLLLVTPVNGERAFNQFRRRRFERAPTFYYRACPVEPSALKRRLHQIKLERVEDPTIASLFEQQREALDRQLSMIHHRERPSFLYDSLALYGSVDSGLLELAMGLLDRLPPQRRSPGRPVHAAPFAEMAEAEIDRYRQEAPDLAATAVIRDDVSSLMVSGGNLLVPSRLRISDTRVEALLHHELGTHMLTNYNGSKQRMRLLGTGLAGYDALQEGLGVFAEFLVGGLSRARLRLLAGRVVASKMVAEGATFVETFRVLTDGFGFRTREAFNVAMRVHRSGGFVKDAVYLRGLRSVLGYAQNGGDLRTLLAGKMSMEQVPVVEELIRRQVLVPPVLEPRYLSDVRAQEKLDWLRSQPDVETAFEEITL